ncbi:MAG: hypothetical protein PHN31_06315 [Candidatus Gracilibacteria bacterium]|nr:hypothetical protein [Candidatus Gracilibacteria bacterium]
MRGNGTKLFENSVLNAFDFKGDEELLIRNLLNGGVEDIFTGINLGIIDHSDEGKSIKHEIDLLKDSFKLTINRGGNIPQALEIEKIIDNVSVKVKEILIKNGFGITNGQTVVGAPIVEKIASTVSYRAFIYWVLKILKSTGFDTKEMTPVDVPNETGKVIYDILNDSVLTSLLIVLKSYEVIKMSGNKGNQFEYEEEVKICNIGKEKKGVINKLEDIGATKVFEGKVEDIYFDYPNKKKTLKQISDSSFRLRVKTSVDGHKSYYYTIKKELSDQEKSELIKLGVLRDRVVDTRICKEKEFEIDFEIVKDIITRFGLQEFGKRKLKYRVSYEYHEQGKEDEGIKFDFDKYAGKQDMLEVEASMQQSISFWLKKLGLDDEKKYPRMATGSTKFFKNKKTDEKLN